MHSKSLLIFLILFCSQIFVSSSETSLEETPMFKIMMSQVELMAKENKSKNGFNKLIAILKELVDSAESNIFHLNTKKISAQIDCRINSSTLKGEIANLLKIKNTRLQQLKKLGDGKHYFTAINSMKKAIIRTKKRLDIYKKTYVLVKSKKENLIKLTKKILPDLKCAKNHFHSLFRYSLKMRKTIAEKAMIALQRSDLHYCYNRYRRSIQEEISGYDDTSKCEFKDAFTRNLDISLPKKKAYTVSIAATHNIEVTLKKLNKYYAQKFSNYLNYKDIVFKLQTSIVDYQNSLRNSYTHLTNYLKIKTSLKLSLKQIKKSLLDLYKSKQLFDKSCELTLRTLDDKLEDSKHALVSYEGLRSFFYSNYKKIAKSMKKKYNDVLVQQKSQENK